MLMDDENYATVLKSYDTTLSLWVAKVHTGKVPGLDHLVLAKSWGISPKKALNMIHWTTQHGIHTVLYPSLSMQFRSNNCQLWYRRSLHNVYSDILFATTLSRRGNRCTKIFATDFGWSCLFPMKVKSEVCQALSLLFQQDRVPTTVMCDKSKEMVLGEFSRKLKEASCDLKQIEAFTPWMNEIQ